MANNTFEAAYMKLKNGMTLFFKDGGARELIEKLQAAVSLIKSIPPGGTTDQVLKKASNDDFDVEWGAGGGSGVVNTWYAVCSSSYSDAAKTATSATGDFVLATGNMVRVKFTNTNNQLQPTLSVDGCTAKRIKNLPSESNINTQWWRAGEVIDLVYDGTDFIMSDGGQASTGYYGKTILSNSTSSASQTTAASSKAVKDTYDAIPSASSATPQDLGTAAAGSSTDYSRADHVHNKPTYSKSDVGLGNVDNVQQYSASNPPPYPVSSVNGQTGTVIVPTVAVQDSTPTNGELVWIDTNDPGTTVTLPEIDDANVSAVNTWSSQKIRDFIYPVGSIYMSVNSTSPATIFGGTWEQIEDTFLLSAGSTYTAGDTGGEATHQLVANELPKISGSFTMRRWSTGGAGTAAQNFSGVFTDSTQTGSANPIAAGSTAGNYQKISMTFGNDQAHNNMPPYLVVYVWKRTA